MGDISFTLKRPETKGKTAIRLDFSYNGERIRYGIGESVKPYNWSFSKQRVKISVTDAGEFNSILDNWEKEAEKIIITAKAAQVTISKQYFEEQFNTFKLRYQLQQVQAEPLHPVLPEQETPAIEGAEGEALETSALFKFWKQFIKDFTGLKAKGTLTNFGITLEHLKAYREYIKTQPDIEEKRVDFGTITMSFYYSFVQYCMDKLDMSNGTIGNQIKNIKTIMQEASDRGLNANITFKNKKFKRLYNETDAIYLTEAELISWASIDLSQRPTLERARDIFLTGCYTGLRYSDFSTILPEHIQGEFISIYKTEKTEIPVVVPLHWIIKDIMKRYAGKTPNSLPPGYSNQKLNDYIKEAGQLAAENYGLVSLGENVVISRTVKGKKINEIYKKWELIVTHTARRSFATNLYLAGFPSISIMKITGHQTEKEFLKYIKVKPQQVADQLQEFWAQQQTKMQQHWEEQHQKIAS